MTQIVTSTKGYFASSLHIGKEKCRSGARDYLVDTLNARKKDGSPEYPLTNSSSYVTTKTLFHNEHGRKTQAYGVGYLMGECLYFADTRHDASDTGKLAQFTASREVIVAGGVFNTPQILKLGGIGPRKELETLGVLVIKDLLVVVSIVFL